MNTQMNTLREAAFNSLSDTDKERYKEGWRARSEKQQFFIDESWAWRMGWKDADNDSVLRSEEMMK